MTTVILGGKKKGSKNLKGGGLLDMVGNVAGTALDMGASVLQKSATMVKGGTSVETPVETPAETTQTGGRRRRRSSRRRSSRRRSTSRSTSRSRKVRRHATRSYRKTKKTRRA